MNKEEACLSVMGAISMELKSSTLQHGFEIICKNLSELEAENVELKKGLSVVNASNSFNKEQLTEAKEIILALLNNFAYPIGREDWTVEDIEVVNKAERFIKE